MSRYFNLKSIQENRLSFLFCLFIFILLFAIGYSHATKGLDLTDEGMYVSAPWRYAMGDIPFRDEIMNSLSPFDVLVSPLFMAFPGITLLQIRLVGLSIHLSSYLVFFIVIARYCPAPVAALSCAVMFLLNNFYGILSPSYNMLSSDFMLASLALLIAGAGSVGRPVRMMASVGGGILCGLAVLSYLSLAPILAIPASLSALKLFSRGKDKDEALPYLLFFLSSIAVLLVFAAALAVTGVFNDFTHSIAVTMNLNPAGADPLAKLRVILELFLKLMSVGVIMLMVFFIAVAVMPARRTKLNVFLGLFIAAAGIFAFDAAPRLFQRNFHGAIFDSYTLPLAMQAFTVCLALVTLAHDYLRRQEAVDEGWVRTRNMSLAWGGVVALLYTFSSSNNFITAIQGLTPVFAVAVISVYRRTRQGQAAEGAELRGRLRAGFLYAVLVVSLAEAAFYYNRSMYRSESTTHLMEPFQSPKLRGIYSTPEKVKAVDELLLFLKDRIKPGRFFLAYDNVPMLYYLTGTRPAYGAVWADDNWPLGLRTDLVNKMVAEKRIPKYAVRMVAVPSGGKWIDGMAHAAQDPLDDFVQSNYYLEEIVYPFEIWRRGILPKHQLLDDLEPVLKSSFIDWLGPDSVFTNDLPSMSAPLIVFRTNGHFRFDRRREGDAIVTRITLVKQDNVVERQPVIRLGYMTGKRGFNPDIVPGSKVVFMLEARDFSANAPRNYPVGAAQIFVADSVAGEQKGSPYHSSVVYKTGWDRYIVSKKIRANAYEVAFGLQWRPESVNDWIEVKEARIYVMPADWRPKGWNK